MSAGVMAIERGLVSCLTCGLLSRIPSRAAAQCPRCSALLHARKPASVIRTWTLLLSALALYVPANVLPIMETDGLFQSQTDTIMSGIVYLWTSGSWPLALIVFIASITVPLLKMLALLVLLLSVHMRMRGLAHERCRLYRVLETIGRWSMLDVYVVAILVTLVQLQSFARVTPAAGALAFGAVVVLTMLATISFDPRLIWDAAERKASDVGRA
jgi:paraquat-inducible protein A